MKFATLLPLADNDGVDLTPVVERIVQELAVQFGGCSVEGTVDGCWIDSGTLYRDRSVRVSVVCGNDRRDEARQRVIEIGRELRQLAMYFEVQMDDGVEFLRIE